MKRALLLGAIACFASVAAGCSCTTAGNFKECATDFDCGSATACSQGYCLPLPAGCRREEAGGMRKAFEEPARIPLVALLPIHDDPDSGFDDSEVQSVNAMKLAISQANDVLKLERGLFGLFVCDTGLAGIDAGIESQAAWFVTNLKVPAFLISSSGPTGAIAKLEVRIDAGTLIISPNATNPSLTTIFRNDGNVWRVAPPDDYQAIVVAKLIKADYPDAGPMPVAILHPTSAYGNGFANPLKAELDSRGFAATLFPYDKNDPNSRNIAANGVANLAPKATVLIGNPADVVPLVERAVTFPVLTKANGHQWYLTDSAKDPAVLTTVTRPQFEGSVGTAPAQGAGMAFATFRDGFTLRYGIDPSSTNYVSHSYDATWMVMLAAQYAEGKDPADRTKVTGPKLAEGMALFAANTGPAIPLRADKWDELATSMANATPTNIEGTSGQLDLILDAGFPMSPYEVWQVSDGGIRVLRLTTP
ncbi:MAG: hypothetical protein U0228_31605 [Myxococcaceae bacterium]